MFKIRLVFRKILLAVFLWTALPPAYAQTQETLTNDTIIELTKLGFDEALIVEKIRYSQNAFDTSVSGLKNLKLTGVSDTVIKAMVGARSSSINAKSAAQATSNDTDRLLDNTVSRPTEQVQNKVYLKNGSIIRGIIVKRVPNVYLEIQTADNKTYVIKYDEVEKITKLVPKPVASPQRESYLSDAREPNSAPIYAEKSPALAFGLSLIFPGAGQYYNGQIAKGIIQDVLFFGGIGVALTLGSDDYNYYYRSYYIGSGSEVNAFFWLGLGVASAAEIWSLIDAPLSAASINKRHQQQDWSHLIELRNGKQIVGLDVQPVTNGWQAKLTMHF